MCELRNRLVHEYIESPNAFLSALKQALQFVNILIETQSRMANYAKNFEQIQ